MSRLRVFVVLVFAITIGFLPSHSLAVSAPHPIEVSYWHFYSGSIGEAHERLVEQFNQSHPSIHVTPVYAGNPWTMRDKLIAALAAGQGPDIAGIDQFWIPQLAQSGYVVPIDTFIRRSVDFQADDVVPWYWETGRYEDRIWSMPFAASNIVLYYNKTLLNDLGLTESDIPQTWTELRQLGLDLLPLAQKRRFWILDVPTMAQRGVVYYFIVSLWQHGGELFTPDLKHAAFQSHAGVETLRFWQDLVKRGIVDVKRPDHAWEAGRALFQFASSARIRSSYQALPFDFGVAPLPRDKYRVTGIGGRNLAMLTKDETKQEAAWTFIKWATGSKVNEAWSEQTGYSPLRRSTYASQKFQAFLSREPRAGMALTEMMYARARPNVLAYAEVSRILGEAVETVLYKEVAVDEVLSQAAVDADVVLQESRDKAR